MKSFTSNKDTQLTAFFKGWEMVVGRVHDPGRQGTYFGREIAKNGHY